MIQSAASTIATVLLPGFSMASLAILTERFTQACGRAPLLYSFDDEMVASEHGIRVQAQKLPQQCREFHSLVVCGGRQSPVALCACADALGRIAVRSGFRIGIGSGVLVLARAGLLNERRCSLPDGLRRELQGLGRGIEVMPGAFTRDGAIWTCCGEDAVTAMLDTLLPVWSRGRCGRGSMLHSEVDDRSTLAEAQALMRSNLSEPLTTREIASYVGISSKRLERIFRRFAGQLPARFYIGLRLSLARQLLHHSSCSIEEVGRRCGFVSASHFSRAFRNHFGLSPRAERQEFTASPEVFAENRVAERFRMAG
ncbi:GlxA family transcriptional regulator [Microbulbifer magnicolonia]|uniref:GlxA family transcriptional regulator n=1 Tax=Microbulbifer magnicolonia TaxID=3109744 RepID=UPI002B40CEF9|nr:helix-turn-helix domain-containing protein [Microbulbifer sp. GG15]